MITLVIPFFNEENTLKRSIPLAKEFLSREFHDYELILVDDGSTDSSLKIAKAYRGPNVKILSYLPNKGKGHAVRTGIMAAEGDVIFFTDSDLPYGLEPLKEGLKKLKDGASIVVGTRNLGEDGYRGYPLVRKIASKSFILLTNTLLGLNLTDIQCGLKGFSKNVAKEIFSKAKLDGFSFDMEVLFLARQRGISIQEIPVSLTTHNESKINICGDSFLMLKDLVAVRMRSLQLSFFPLLYAAMMLRFLGYGLKYFPQLDDYIQYHNYRAFGGSPWGIVTHLGLLAARPLAGLADLYVWTHFWGFMIVAVFFITLMHAWAAKMFHSLFKRYFCAGIVAPLIFCLIPANFEGTYWISASSRIVVGFAFSALSAKNLQLFFDVGLRKNALLFAFFQLLGFGFYEQLIPFSLAATFVLILVNRKTAGEKAFAGLLSLVNAGFYFLFTGLFANSPLYSGRMELILPNDPYYGRVFLPEVLQQIKSAFLGAGGFITLRGLLRAPELIVKEKALLYLVSSLLVSGGLAFYAFKHNEKVKKPFWLFLAGLILAAAPMAPFFVVGNPWISIRATTISYLGIGLAAESIISTLIKDRRIKSSVVFLLSLVFLAGSFTELHDYRLTFMNDTAVVEKLAAGLKDVDPKLSIAVLNLNPSYLDKTSYYYHEHIHGVTESSWALTGALQTALGTQLVPSVTPIACATPIYKEYDKFSNYDVFYLFEKDEDPVLLTLKNDQGVLRFYDKGGYLRAKVTRDKNGTGTLWVIEN